MEKWDLSFIKPLSIDEIDKLVSKFCEQELSENNFLDKLNDLENIRKEISKLGCSAQLKFCENTADQNAVAYMSKVENYLAKVSNRLLFFSLWFKDLDDARAQKIIKKSGDNAYFLELLRKYKPFTLNESEEKIINIKDVTGASALNTIYNILATSFDYEIGEKKLSQEEVTALVRDVDPAVREKAYRALLKPYTEQKNVLGEIYKNIVTDWRAENVELRGYKTSISARNLGNDLPDEAVEALLKVCSRKQKLFHRFFEIKRKKLGLKKLRRFDLYAPVELTDVEISYDAALEMVLNAYGNFSAEFRAEAEKIIREKRIHSTLHSTKQTGAFCMSVISDISPYVLVNYTGKMRDVSTLAHELGHGVHHNLARNNTEFTFHSVLPLAETASIFGEMLLSEKLVSNDPEKAKGMIFRKLDELYASIIRQVGFVEFEIKAHEMINGGKTIDEISAVYLQDLKKQLGPGVEVDDIFAYEWTYIPHIFHTPFYCYAYAFGNLLTLALWESYKEQGGSFVPKFIAMLAAGGGASPVEITKKIGVDITSEKFWEKGFMVIDEMIKKLEDF